MAIRDMRKYVLQSLILGNSQNNQTHTEDTYDYNQALLDEQFEQLGNVYTIEEEKNRGSGIYEPIRASISIARSIDSKSNIVDNDRTLTFQDNKHDVWIGKRYKFENNVWLTINTSTINTLINNSLVQRCNNTLKWYDFDDEKIYEEPCVIGDKVSVTKVGQETHIQVIQGELSVVLQYNETSKKVKENQRFIINGKAYEVKSVQSAKRLSTYDKNSIGNITIELELTEKNPAIDDLENNIAYKVPEVSNGLLNGNIVTPDIHELTMFAPYNVGTFEVYKYIDSVKQEDTFTFEFFDAPTSKYQVVNTTLNSFTIKCLDYSNGVPLAVQYKNMITNETNEFVIELRGVL